MSREDASAVEPDRLEGTPHPREQLAFFGHPEAEAAFVEGIRSGRLHHAWLIGGPQGIGKATLAYRVARSLLNCPPSAYAGLADLHVDSSATAARQIIAFSHPNVAVLRRARQSARCSAARPGPALRLHQVRWPNHAKQKGTRQKTKKPDTNA